MAIDGVEITSDVPAERLKVFSAAEALRGVLASLVDLLLPPICFSWRKRVGAHGLLCDCWTKIDFIAPLCLRLGVPLPYDTGEPSLSAAAIADPPVYDHPRAAARCSSTMRDLIQSFKYGDRHGGPALVRALDGCWSRDVLVPVPLYRSRFWSRRFNQSAMLGQAVAALTSVPVDCFLLARVKRTPSQVGLSAAQRRKNVAGAFRFTAARGQLRGKRIIVVNDLINTGATVEACTRVLKGAAAVRVNVLALAPGRGTFGQAAIVWNLLGAPPTYNNTLRLNGRSSGTSMTRIILYTTPYCGYCRAAKHLLTKKGAMFTEIDVGEDLERRQEMIARAFGGRTVPQIFINDTHVGGYDELAELEREAKLDALLAEVDAAATAAGE
jgi:GrxC family glutaredoxin